MSIIYAVVAAIILVLIACWLWTRKLAADAEKAVPQAGDILPVKGGAIHFTDEGPRDGQTLVLIHGLAGSMHNMKYGLAGELASDFRVITIDRPGTGYSSRDSDDQARFAPQTDMIWELLDKLGVEKPVLVGHSLGGALSLAMALQRKERVAGLALIAPLTMVTPGPPDVFKPLVIGSPFLRRLIGHTISAPLAKLTTGKVLSEVFAPEPAPADFLTRGGGILGLRPKSFISASADLNGVFLSMPDQVARYGGLGVPGGVLYGEEDNLLSPDRHGRSMQAHGLFYEGLPGRGHMIPVTMPETCAQFVRKVAAMTR